jgi:predicted RNA-binding Zn-ribbon protein involved in translation (DUF1610 family)
MHVRVCPACGEEFRPEIVRCSDCGAELQDAHDDDGPPAPQVVEPGGDSADEDAEDYTPIFTAIESEVMRDAAAALAGAGVPFRASGNATGFQLLVRPDDRARAARALAGRDGAVAFRADPGEEAAGGEPSCPACGAALRASAVECPDCWLVVGDAEGST